MSPINTPSILAIAVGNTRTRLARLDALVPTGAQSLPTPSQSSEEHAAAIASAAATLLEDQANTPILIASVNADATRRIQAALTNITDADSIYVLGRDAGIPMSTALDDDSTVGHDRLLSCLGAFALLKEAAVVVDAGTCITVNFIDGTGVFQGGAIAPGLSLMLRAMHEHTAALPLLTPTPEDLSRGVFGKDTPHAMNLGVIGAARGLVRYHVERFAEVYGAYPRILATGGDAPLLFDNDDLVERIEPNLQLIGIAHAAILNAQSDSDHSNTSPFPHPQGDHDDQ